jgi:hypothetical protein
MINEGYSGSKLELIKKNNILIVKKTNNIKRNLERYESLNYLNLSMPKIFNTSDNFYEMEYIYNIPMSVYIQKYDVDNLIDFILKLLNNFTKNCVEKDFTNVYINKLENFNFKKYNLPFNADQLIDKLPKILPESEYYGDLTLDNILFDIKNNRFVLIDPATIEYNSFVFDISKLKQDLICKWFIRNKNFNLDKKLNKIYESLNKYPYYDNNYLLILMLMRILLYSKNIKDEKFLYNNIVSLWNDQKH